MSSDRLKFVSTFLVCPEDSELNSILKGIDRRNTDVRNKEFIDRILKKYSEEHIGGEESYVRNVLVESFAKLLPKKNIRKYMYEKLNLLRIGEETFFEHILRNATERIATDITFKKTFNISQNHRICFFLYSYTQNFVDNSRNDYFYEKTFPLFICILDAYTSQLNNPHFLRDDQAGKSILEYDDCQAVLMMALDLFSRTIPSTVNDSLTQTSLKMVLTTYKMMTFHARMKFEMLNKCATIFTHFTKFLPEEEKIFTKWKRFPVLDFVDNDSNDYTLKLKTTTVRNLFGTDRTRIALNLAIYQSINHEDILKLSIGSVPLMEHLYLDTLHLGKIMTCYPDLISKISRTASEMIQQIADFDNYEVIFERSLEFVWGHLDHYVDCVAIATKSLLATLLKQVSATPKHTRHLETFFNELNAFSEFSKVRTVALTVVCENINHFVVLTYCRNVCNELLQQAANGGQHELAANAYMHLLKECLRSSTEEEFIAQWLRPVLVVLKNSSTRYCCSFINIVTRCVRERPTIFRKLFTPVKLSGLGVECVIILKCIHHARMNGIVFPLEADANPKLYWRNLIIKSKLELFMIHQDNDVRIGALQVIAECQKSTEEFIEWELHYLIKFLQYNVATQCARFKSQLVAFYKKIFTRYHLTSMSVLKRLAMLERKTDKEDKAAMAVLAEERRFVREYRCFMIHFVQLLILYLSSDASFSRRAVSLEMLIYLHVMSKEDEWERLFNQDEVNKIKHLLHDGYESNKIMAVMLLRTLPAANIGFDTEENTRKFFDSCMKMATDVRPSQSISASYMFQTILQSEFPFKTHSKAAKALTSNNQCLMLVALIEKLQEMFESSKEDVMEAASTTPFYGLLLSCRNLLRNRYIREENAVYSYVFQKLTDLCLSLKSHIMPVVCNSSPEGYIPENSDESDDLLELTDQALKAQKVLVYSWKTMKEIMLLLSEIANQSVALEEVHEMLPEKDLFRIGDFFMDVFIESKHRGVFEQASTAFTSICRSFFNSKKEKLNSLPLKWADYAISLCTGKKTDDRLCSTRRSAGLPFLTLSILPVVGIRDREILGACLNPLFRTTKSGSDELKMHCYNVLRALFKNSQLTETIVPFLGKAVVAALLGFSSRIWGVRNSATLLFTTLMTKIFGMSNTRSDENESEGSKITLAVFHLRYQDLFEFIFATLAQECGKVDSLVLHPVLLILSRLFPSNNEEINAKVNRYIPFVNSCFKNSSYRTRDLAARASVSLMSEYCLRLQLSENFARIADKSVGDTECQGLLLQIRHIFHTTIFDTLPISEYILKSRHLLLEAGRRFSHFTVALYIDIVYMLLTKYRDYKNLVVMKEMVVLLSTEPSSEELTTAKATYGWSRFKLLAFILMNKFQHVGSTYRILTRIIVNALNSTDLELKSKCLHFMIYLNQEYSDDQYREHALITSYDVEICPLTKSLVHTLDAKSKKQLLTFTHPHMISFFYSELRTQLKDHEHYFVLIFLLLRFYPCFFSSLRTDRKQNILDWFTTMAKVYNEEIIAGVIMCLKTFVGTLDVEEKKQLLYSDMIRLLMESAAPAAADFRRLTVAQFLIGTQELFKNRIYTEFDRYNVLNIVMVLLEDDEEIVRNTISDFPSKNNKVVAAPILWKVIPNKARYTLLLSCGGDFKDDLAICCLCSWAVRYLPEVTADVSEVYERGELNAFAENIPVTYTASCVLQSKLWKLEDALSFEDRSIFVEEQTVIVTLKMLNALIKVPSPMMDKQTKRTVICALKCINKFSEQCTVGRDFQAQFKNFFNAKILKFLRASLTTDYSTAKTFLTYLYNPLLNAHL